MSFSLRYHPKAVADLKRLDREIQKRVTQAIEAKAAVDPYRFGKPLQYHLKGARSLRVGDYRVIYMIKAYELWILAVFHRRFDYRGIEERLVWFPR